MKMTKKLRALFWAEIHMREAHQGCQHLASLRDISLELRDCIYAGIVVSYSRSFGANNGLSAIDSKFEQFTAPKLQVLHEAMLEARNTIYAHMDLLKVTKRLSAGMPKTEIKKIVVHLGPDGRGHWTVQRPTMPVDRLADISQLCLFQADRIHRESTAMLSRLFHEKSLAPGEHLLDEA
jgi:hypothetical protein